MPHSSAVASPFTVRHLGIVMRRDPGCAGEAEGLQNPGAARGPDGELYLFPSIVGKNGSSRIGIARVLFDGRGDPAGVERLGYALEPEESYELRRQSGMGGVQDPRVTYVQVLGLYVMAYVAWGARGWHVALAISENCLNWERLGLVDFQPDLEAHYRVAFNRYQNNAAAFVPETIERENGEVVIGMLHRPFYDKAHAPKGVANAAPGIWLSSSDLRAAKGDIRHLRIMNRHELLAAPDNHWESMQIGLGTPAVRTRLGHMIVYHGSTRQLNRINYATGLLFFRHDGNRLLRYRSSTPIPGVRCPTGIDEHSKDNYDIYFGTADKSIGAARIRLPEALEFEEIRHVG